MCTNFFLRVAGKEKGFINGRSMEFGEDLRSKLFFRAAGHHFNARDFGDYQYEWTGRHNVIGVNSYGLPLLTDGMNDAGLATGDLWMLGSEYQKITDKKLGLSIDRFCMWMLSSFATVGQVKQAIERGDVQVGAPAFVQNLLPLHFPVHDADGNSIVIEFTGSKPMVYDNPVGTLTNQPVFPWQLENLRNYVDITPWDFPAMTINGLTVEPTGHGSGMMHLPSDAT